MHPNQPTFFQKANQNKPWQWKNQFADLQLLIEAIQDQEDTNTPKTKNNTHKPNPTTSQTKNTKHTVKQQTKHITTQQTPNSTQKQKQKTHHAKHTESIAVINTMGWKHNTKGDKWIPKTKTFTSLMRAEDIHILGLTGLDWKSEEELNQFMDQLPPDFIGIGAQGREPDRPQSTTGVALIIQNNPNNPIELSHTKRCPTGRWISTRINREDKSSIRVMTIYAPAGNKPDTTKPRTILCEDIHKWSKAQTDYMAATDKKYLMGDFNASLHGSKTKDLQFQTLLKTTGLKAFNEQHHGTTFYGSGHNTLIDYITGNNIATDMHCNTTIQTIPEIQTDHKLIKTITQTTTAMRNGNKKCTRNTTIRSTKLYRTRSKEVWQRAFIDILQQQEQDQTTNTDTKWNHYIQTAGEKFMSKGKAQNELQETTFKEIGQLQKSRAIVNKLQEALQYLATGETRPAITGCRNTANYIRRKWRQMDHTTFTTKHPKHINPQEAKQLIKNMNKKEWANKEQYGKEIQELRDNLLKQKQMTINVTKAGHEYENFIMDQSKRKHQIVSMTNPKGELKKGNQATAATAQQWQDKFTSKNPGPLGYTGTTKQPQHTEQDIKEYMEAITETAFTAKYREETKLQLTDKITEEDFIEAATDMNNNKQAGTDEEMIQFYKLIFNIKPPENPENWTDLERHRHQTIAKLETERKLIVEQLLTDINQYITTLAENNWKDQANLSKTINLRGLQELHKKIHTGDIKGIPKNNGKDEKTILAWRPIMCLNTIRKIITKIISNRTYKLIQATGYSMLSPMQFGYQKRTGVPQALYTAKLTMQHLINQGTLPIQIFIDVAAAYDSVEWDKLAETLQLKNFKQTEINLIMNLMTNMQAITSTVWGDSEEFPLQRGVPQGDSLSPIIFIIFMDTIIRIMNKKQLQSTLLQHSTQGYVDDIWGIVENLETAKTFITQCKKALNWMGLDMNMDKTEILFSKGHKQHPQKQTPKKTNTTQQHTSQPMPPTESTTQNQHIKWTDNNTEFSIKIVPNNKSIRYLGWYTDHKLNSDEQHTQIARRLAAKLAALHMQGRCLEMWDRGIKVYCNTLVNHLATINWTAFGKHSKLNDLKTMISQKLRMEGELSRTTSDNWFYMPTNRQED